jgi:beta propeller repeat protein
MKKIGCFIVIFTLLFTGCENPLVLKPIAVKSEDKFSVSGFESEADGNNLLVSNGNGLKLYDLTSKKLLKEISIPHKQPISGFDISGDYIAWADARNETRDISSLAGDYNINSDIFIYNIKTDEQMQITKDLSAQVQPKVWKNYLIYADNRNDTVKSYPGKWSLFIYNINTKKEELISSTLSAHGDYSIRDNKIVWEDDRNFKGSDTLRGGDNVPENNKDIYLFDMTRKKETAVATGKLMESKPDVYGDYIVYEDRNSGTINADIVLYNIKTKKKINVTRDKYNQGDPKLYGDYVVWMDERRGTSTNDVVINGKKPNSDIFIYNIKTKEKKLLTGDEPQISPSISNEWVSYTTSRQINPIVEAIRYR